MHSIAVVNRLRCSLHGTHVGPSNHVKCTLAPPNIVVKPDEWPIKLRYGNFNCPPYRSASLSKVQAEFILNVNFLAKADFVFSFLRTLTTWHCPPLLLSIGRASIDGYPRPIGLTVANLQLWVCCCRPMLGQTDGWTPYRYIKPCSTCGLAVSCSNILVKFISLYLEGYKGAVFWSILYDVQKIAEKSLRNRSDKQASYTCQPSRHACISTSNVQLMNH